MHMIRQRAADALDPWLEAAQARPVAPLRNFALHLRQDYAAVKTALTMEGAMDRRRDRSIA